MKAGVVRGKFKAGKLDEVVQVFRGEALPAFGRIRGFKGAQLWVNRETGDSLAVGIYETSEAREQATSVVGESLTKLAPHLAGARPERELYDLAASTAMEARAIVERGVEAFNSGDLEQLARDSAPDIVFSASGGMEYKGPQAVKEYNQNWRTAFPDARIKVTNIVALGNTVVLEGEFSGTHAGTLATPMGDIRSTGKKVKDEFVQVFTIDRGLVSSVRLYFDRMSLMTQLGLAPTGTQAS